MSYGHGHGHYKVHVYDQQFIYTVKCIDISKEEYKLHDDTKLTDDIIKRTKKSVTQISDRPILKKHVHVTIGNAISKTYHEINLLLVILYSLRIDLAENSYNFTIFRVL